MIFVGGSPMSLPTYAALTASLFGAAFQRVMVRYPAIDNSDNTVAWAKIQTDDFLICSTRHLAENMLSPVYTYLFDHQPSFQVWGGPVCRSDDIVCHGAELPFVFHTADKIGGHFTAAEEALSAAMMDDWTSFARTLVPLDRHGSASAIHWPRFSDASRIYLSLNTPALSLQSDPYRDTCAFWDKIGYDLTTPYGSHAAADRR
jgi:carboxylesterase type B